MRRDKSLLSHLQSIARPVGSGTRKTVRRGRGKSSYVTRKRRKPEEVVETIDLRKRKKGVGLHKKGTGGEMGEKLKKKEQKRPRRRGGEEKNGGKGQL